MSCPIDKENITKLKTFIELCAKNPEILHLPELSFLRNFMESLGAKIPEPPKTFEQPPEEEKSAPEQPEVVDSDEESVLEFDMEGCVEPDEVTDAQVMGDSNKQPTEEEEDQADLKRSEAMGKFTEGNFEDAIKLYTEAIELNPQSALLFSKRGQAFLKLSKPNACIKDCTQALELNCDSAAAYKFRGRAYRLIGEWENSAKDLRQAVKIDFDEQTDEWLKEVQPNAQKIEQHNLKQERKRFEKEEKDRQERIRQARAAHESARASKPAPDFGDDEIPSGGVGDFLKNPEIAELLNDPDVATAFEDIMKNPANIMKYRDNPKVQKAMEKLGGLASGFNFRNTGGFPNFTGGFPTQGSASTGATPDDDALD